MCHLSCRCAISFIGKAALAKASYTSSPTSKCCSEMPGAITARSVHGLVLNAARICAMAFCAMRFTVPSPSCMYGSRGAMFGIVEKDGDAVGRRHADTNARHVGNECVNAFQNHLAHVLRHRKQLAAHLSHGCFVGLVGHNEVRRGDAQHAAQAMEVLRHVFGGIATIGIDVKLGVSALACAIGTHGTESVNAVAKRVFQQFRTHLRLHIQSRQGLRCRRRCTPRRCLRPRRPALAQSS